MRLAALILALCLPAHAATYYLSATGSDSNNGTTTGTPWLSPNHALNCGDTITAAASTSYSATNFASGKWGTVTCAANNNVAWLICASFDACKISITSGSADGMRVSANYWGVQGWEVDSTSTSASGGSCFTANPPTSGTSIHHIIFANNVATGCGLGGLGGGNNGTASVDYLAIIGNIAYATASHNTFCGSGISIYEPVASDALPGTHLYIAGNFSWANIDPNPGYPTPPTCFDGSGIIMDTPDGDQTPMPVAYPQQIVIDNNISVSNAGSGVRIANNSAVTGASGPFAHIYVRQNTMWGNSGDMNQYGDAVLCGELTISSASQTQAFGNIGATAFAACFGDAANPAYAYFLNHGDVTDKVYATLGSSGTGSYYSAVNSTGFVIGPNFSNSSPSFVNATTPGAPSCGSAASVPNCMATVIANFTPTAGAAKGYGYQVPSATSVYDPLYPQWLCSVTLPSGLVTPGCVTGTSITSSVSGGTIR